MSDYTCFLHPQEKGPSLEATCPVCGHIFGFPLVNPPKKINGKEVVRALNRGFYGAVFLTRHPRLPRQYAVKVIPHATYAPPASGGYGKDFQKEAELHVELSAIDIVAALQDMGDEDLMFGNQLVPCHWMEMEYVDGPTLNHKIGTSPDDPREVAQIAWDLLDLVDAFQQRRLYHNDLHGNNIMVVHLEEAQGRRHAIHPRIRVKVLDLGSAADATKSGPERFGDVHWVALHILQLINAFEARHLEMEPSAMRLCAQIRRVAEYYCGIDPDRAPKATDMKAAIQGAYNFGVRPWAQPVHLGSISEHYNAQTLPPWFAPELFYDPDERWGRRLVGPGPQLLVGMRGCGKTILLRSLEWSARLHKRKGESDDEVASRVKSDKFLGLFVSCASLQRSPRAKTLEHPLHRLFLAFSREVVRDVQLCDLLGLGTIDYTAIKGLNDLVGTLIPWYKPPADLSDVVLVEQALSRAFQAPNPAVRDAAELNPRTAFDALAAATRRLVDLWVDKKLLFLLDDVSVRYLPVENVEHLLSQLCLQSPEFGFKVSTESQTLSLRTPGGELARVGRDYDMFDLGVEVLATLRGPTGHQFIAEVLRLRSAATIAGPGQLPAEVLGSQSLLAIATAIREQPSKSPVYWGIEALAGVCVGDIGDVLQIYALILDRAGGTPYPIAHDIQHKAMVDFAEGKLFSLAGRDQWLYSHAIAFAAAAHLELKKSDSSRLREYAEIFVKIEPSDAPTVFPRIIDLIDAGVFVFAGGTPRTKTRHGAPFLQFKLAYRKVFGLTNRIPLAMRDRFELPGKSMMSWLDAPSAAKFKPTKRIRAARDTAIAAAETPPIAPLQRELADQGTPRQRTREVQPDLFTLLDEAPREATITEPVPKSHTLYTVETLEKGELASVKANWSTRHVIGAFGFEARSVGAWNALLQAGQPGAATMLHYTDAGLTREISELLNRSGVPFLSTGVESVVDQARVREIIRGCADRDVVIDTTSLTKSLIYSLVLESLLQREEVWVLHTCALEYFPADDDLASLALLLKSGNAPEAFGQLNSIVAGESGPYDCMSVGAQHHDPSQPSFLVAFVPLKYDRLAQLLDEVPVEAIAAVAPIHSSGAQTNRCAVTRYLGTYFVQRYNGSYHELSSLDHDGTFRLLSRLHREKALEGGFNFEIALTGAKMHAVGAAMLAATALPASVYYSRPTKFDPSQFTKGTGVTRIVHLRRVPQKTEPS
jgi:serine/threonine protein kinase